MSQQYKLRLDVNKNPTKVGIKVQFVFPSPIGGDERASATQKLQQKLNTGLQQYGMTAQLDNDVPYDNIIGFTIPLTDIKLLIKNIFSNNNDKESDQI